MSEAQFETSEHGNAESPATENESISEEDTAALVFAMQQASMFVREDTTVDDYLENADKIFKRLRG